MQYLFVFAILIAGISAEALQPQNSGPGRSISEGMIIDIVGNVSAIIQNAGFDPIDVNSATQQWALSVPEILTVTAFHEKIFCYGLSNIVILNVHFSILAFRITYDFQIPEIYVSTERSDIEIVGMGESVAARAAGSITILGGRADGNFRVSVGSDRITLRELTINLTVEEIKSNIKQLDVYTFELADRANKLVGETIPRWLNDFREEINTLLEIVLWDPIEWILNYQF